MLLIARQIYLFILILNYIHISGGTAKNINNATITPIFRTGSKYSKFKSVIKYIASIRYRTFDYIFGDDLICAGCIISPKLIITSAICLMKNDQPYDHTELSVVVGSPNRFVYSKDTERLLVRYVIVHPNYTIGDWNWNIGLLKLHKSITINNRTAAIISLPKRNIEKGALLCLTGWGRYYKNGPKPGRLVFTDIDVTERDMCSVFHIKLGENEYCAAETDLEDGDPCVGFKGGTAIHKNTIVGIVEYSPTCINILQPVRFLTVYNLVNWITENGSSKILHSIYYCLISLIIFLCINLN